MEREIAIRLFSFVLIFILVALWEIRKPRRALTTSKKWRWFGTYLARPSKGHQDMIIGLSQFRDHRRLTLPWLLLLPLIGDPGKQPINR